MCDSVVVVVVMVVVVVCVRVHACMYTYTCMHVQNNCLTSQRLSFFNFRVGMLIPFFFSGVLVNGKCLTFRKYSVNEAAVCIIIEGDCSW